MMFQMKRLNGMLSNDVRGLPSQLRSGLGVGVLVMAGAIMIGQAAPAGGGGASCYHMHNTGPCGGGGETSQDFLVCLQETCTAWYIVAGQIYECIACQGPDGWYCTNHGQVTRTKYTAYCTVPEGICDYTAQVLQTCTSAVATSTCICPPTP